MLDGQFLAVNIGCGPRFSTSPNWINFDFDSKAPQVRRCNLLAGIPLPEHSVDFIYSSHVLEHFSVYRAKDLLLEMRRILKPGGIVRIVVPDLEDICRNYLLSLDKANTPDGTKLHAWAVVELIDQMVRIDAGGEMAKMWRSVKMSNDELLRTHIKARSGFDVNDLIESGRRPLFQRIRGLSLSMLQHRILARYVQLVTLLLPRNIGDAVVDRTPLGEKHKWMYDRISLARLLAEVGFKHTEFHSANTSNCQQFLLENLDLTKNGVPHAPVSLFAEAQA